MRLDIKSIALLVLTGACILFFGMWFFKGSDYKDKIKELENENKKIELVRDSLKTVNASLKLQTHTIIPPSRQDTKVKYTRKEKYINNKKDSIEVCKYYIKNDEKLLNFLNSNKKLDDFSDAFLQTISYIRKNGNKIENVSLDDKNILR